MPWTYLSVSSPPRRTHSAWASPSNSCRQYGLTEVQVASADPPIPFQVRSRRSNPYAVVKLDDVPALKDRLVKKEKEDERRLIEEPGSEEYERRVGRLVEGLEEAVRFSRGGVAATLEGRTITETAAKEWNVNVADLPPADPGKKRPRYHLADVIGAADREHRRNDRYRGLLPPRVKKFSEKRHLYARFLVDKCREECGEEEDPAIVRAAYDSVRGGVTSSIEDKEAELAAERACLDAFDVMVKETSPDGGDEAMFATAKNKGCTLGARNVNGEEENIENNSKRPAAKKQKVTAKGLSVFANK